ncbi:MAG: cytochrome c [Acidobacteria bacterium]|nr:cytochrome c [Acidobacteriota bacterium]
MQTRRTAQLLLIAAAGLTLGACSNFPSRQTQVWVWDDMKKQDKYKPQMSSAFFSDGRASRGPVEGALAQEHYRADEPYFTGVAADGNYVARNPEPLTKEVLLRGQNKFNVYCSPCHDRTGSGRGIVPAKATWIPGNMHDDRVVNFVDGEIFHVITMGRRSMPGYRFQIQEKDRWAIVAYVRALQRAGHGSMADVPVELQAKVR